MKIWNMVLLGTSLLILLSGCVGTSGLIEGSQSTFEVIEKDIADDTRLLGFWNFNGTGKNTVESNFPGKGSDLMNSVYENGRFHNEPFTESYPFALTEEAFIVDREKVEFKTGSQPKPHVLVDQLNKDSFSCALGFDISAAGRGSILYVPEYESEKQQSRVNEMFSEYGAENNGIRQSEKAAIWDREGVQYQEFHSINLLQFGTVGRWLTVRLMSEDGNYYEIYAVFNNGRIYRPTSVFFDRTNPVELFFSFNNYDGLIDFYLNGEHHQLSYDPIELEVCGVGGAANYRITLFTHPSTSPMSMDYLAIKNGTSTYEDFLALKEEYYLSF